MLTLAAADTLAANAQTATTVTVSVFGMELVGTTETYKVLYQGQPGTSVATIYTVPASTTAFIKSISIVNTASTAQTFALYRGGTAAANRLTPDVSLPGKGWAEFEDGQGWQVYNAFGQLLSNPQIGSKQLAQTAIPVTETTVYTVPTGTMAIVQGIDICNTASGATFRIHFVPSGGSAGTGNAIFYDMTLLGGATLSWGGPQVLGAGGFIVVKASITGVTTTISGQEVPA